jgi:hypothetical protein
MIRFCGLFLRAMILLLICVATCQATAQSPQRTIKEGVGWEHFSVGASANSLVDLLGFPDKHSSGRMMRWDKAGLNCLMNEKGDQAVELRFEKRFKGVTESGVKFGMSADKVRKIYGDAGEMVWREGGMKLIWPSRGILIWFHNNAVYQIVIFRPQNKNAIGSE